MLSMDHRYPGPASQSSSSRSYHSTAASPQFPSSSSSHPPPGQDFSHDQPQDAADPEENSTCSTPLNNHDNHYTTPCTFQPQDIPAPVSRFTEEWDISRRGSSIIADVKSDHTVDPVGNHHANSLATSVPSLTPTQQTQNSIPAPASSEVKDGDMERTASVHSFNAGDDSSLPLRQDSNNTANNQVPARGNTLKKKGSTRRPGGSMRRSNSRRSMRAGSVRSLAMQSGSDPDEGHSAFYCPIPTNGNPTDVLANRFHTWRKILKDLIAYFREIQNHYEARTKSLVKVANTSNNISTPAGFLSSAGIDDALKFLRSFNKNAIVEANKAKEIEEDVILALTGLRSDLQQKIKEIKNLSGDFKNSVKKEMDNTVKVVRTLEDALDKNEMDSSTTTGKQDPFLLRLAVDRQVERQIDEENYLHQAYLNLESSGRELEAIVVGEIQKAYNAYAGILKREADNAYGTIGELRDGPITMPKDQEWIHFVTHDDQFVDPTIPLRSPEQIHYPGQLHVSAQEIRAGLLERKSKYLKSYTAGWYVLSTTHLHEFKSADKGQAPVMSLYLPEQKLGSHSEEGGSSNKFILKGRQTGSMHRGHTWVFRAESHDTMMAWYEDIKALTEKSPEERTQFVRTHSRSMSRSSRRSVSSDGMVDDDEDDEPFSAGSQLDVTPGLKQEPASRRSQPGGRFPSDIQVNAQRGLQADRSPSSLSSGNQDQQRPRPAHDDPDATAIAAAGALPGATMMGGAVAHDQDRQDAEYPTGYGGTDRTPMEEVPSGAFLANQEAQHDGVNPYTSEPVQNQQHTSNQDTYFISAGAAGPRHDDDGLDSNERQGEEQQQAPARDFAGDSKDETSGNGTAGDHVLAALGGAGAVNGSETTHELSSSHDDLDSVATTEASTVDGTTTPRPTDNNTRHDSVMTVSNLHVPGQYPKGSVAGL